MSKTAAWLIAGAALILVGGILFVGVMTSFSWDFGKLSTEKYLTNSYDINEDFSSVSIDATVADITFAAAEDGKCSVVCYEEENQKHTVGVEGGELKVELVDTRKWYEHIGIGFSSPKITVYMPTGEYGALDVKCSTGHVEIPDELDFVSIDIKLTTGDIKCYASAEEHIRISATTGSVLVQNSVADELDIRTTTGNITVCGFTSQGSVCANVSTGKTVMENVTAGSVSTEGNTGDVRLENVIASELLDIERSTGDVRLIRCDAANIEIETDTGDVDCTLLSGKIFEVETDTGSRDVPSSTSGGKCKVDTDTGDVKIRIES